jgi:hypothetical protein
MDSQSIKELILEQKKEFEKQEQIISRTLLQDIKDHLTIPPLSSPGCEDQEKAHC